MDLYSRAIVGWAFDGDMTKELIIRALNMAISRQDIEPGLIIHSDRGVQYRSVRYQELIMSVGAVSSMSRRSNCWDNAVMESFFSPMKVELIYGEKFNSLQEVKSCIFEYIEIFIIACVSIQHWAISAHMNTKRHTLIMNVHF